VMTATVAAMPVSTRSGWTKSEPNGSGRDKEVPAGTRKEVLHSLSRIA
jgi:hypothetical protein